MEATDKLAAFISETSLEKIPRAAIDIAQRSILDCIGVTLAGSTEHEGKIITEFVRESGGNPLSTVIAGGFKTSPFLAALANGTMGHALDYDDVSRKMSHPTVVLLPAVLALGEVRRISGKQVLESYLVGYETWAKLASVIPGHSDQGWHSASTTGSLGAAAATAHLLGLDPEKVKTALSLAVTQAGGSKRQFGTMAKPFHAGNGARNGVMAAMLAEKGFSADPTILEGAFGFGDLFGGRQKAGDLGEALEDIGDFFNMLKIGVGIKPYPCRATNHSSIEAALQLANEHDLAPEQVERIECTMNRKIEIGYSEVKTPLEAKFSLAYCIAIAIVDRKVGLTQFTEERVFDPKAHELIKKVKLNYDPNLIKIEGPVGSATTSVLSIKMKDGKTYSHRVNKAKGTAEVPLSEEDLSAKYRDCAQLVLSEDKIQRSVDLLEHLENINNINELTNLII